VRRFGGAPIFVYPIFRSVGELAGLVVIRTFLSFSLEVEVDGRGPWARPQASDARPGQLPS
jgi:hypothetical protein